MSDNENKNDAVQIAQEPVVAPPVVDHSIQEAQQVQPPLSAVPSSLPNDNQVTQLEPLDIEASQTKARSISADDQIYQTYLSVRGPELENRVQELKGQYSLLAFQSLVICIVFVLLLISNRKQWIELYNGYPQAAIYIVVSTILYGMEFPFQYYTAIKFSIACNRPMCKLAWLYFLCSNCICFWGAHHIFDPRFEQFFKDSYPEVEHPKMKSIVIAMFVLRFIGAIFLSFLMFLLSICFCGLKTGNAHQRRENRNAIECLTLYLIPPMINVKTRDFDKKTDTEPSCAICLIDFKDKPDQKVAQLGCNKHHIFHEDCLKMWLFKNNICPLCRQPVPEGI